MWFMLYRSCLNALLVFTIAAHVPVAVYGQRVILGGKAGGQITGMFTGQFPITVRGEDKVAFGPMVEVGLPRRFSLEVDALHKTRINYTRSSVDLSPTRGFRRDETREVMAHSWEFPVIVKWNVPKQGNRIFVGAGFSAREVAGTTHVFGATRADFASPTTSFDFRTSQGDVVHPWTYAAVLTGGIDARKGILHLQPELRYTHWDDSPFFVPTKRDTFQILIGVAIGK